MNETKSEQKRRYTRLTPEQMAIIQACYYQGLSIRETQAKLSAENYELSIGAIQGVFKKIPTAEYEAAVENVAWAEGVRKKRKLERDKESDYSSVKADPKRSPKDEIIADLVYNDLGVMENRVAELTKLYYELSGIIRSMMERQSIFDPAMVRELRGILRDIKEEIEPRRGTVMAIQNNINVNAEQIQRALEKTYRTTTVEADCDH